MHPLDSAIAESILADWRNSVRLLLGFVRAMHIAVEQRNESVQVDVAAYVSNYLVALQFIHRDAACFGVGIDFEQELSFAGAEYYQQAMVGDAVTWPKWFPKLCCLHVYVSAHLRQQGETMPCLVGIEQ